jgi:hypothetical protein
VNTIPALTRGTGANFAYVFTAIFPVMPLRCRGAKSLARCGVWLPGLAGKLIL